MIDVCAVNRVLHIDREKLLADVEGMTTYEDFVEETYRHIFFFSSRRRHTRWPRDWSSDVCSSDLRFRRTPFVLLHCYPFVREAGWLAHVYGNVWFDVSLTIPHVARPAEALREALELRSEERRVGKECRAGGAVVR